MTIDQFLSYLFLALAFSGGALSLAILPSQIAAKVYHETKNMIGPSIATRIHIRTSLVFLWTFAVILILGLTQTMPHQPYDLIGWINKIAVLSVPSVMIVALLANRRDVSKIAVPRSMVK